MHPLLSLAEQLPQLPDSSLRADRKRQLARLIRSGSTLFEDPVKPKTSKNPARPSLNMDDTQSGPEDEGDSEEYEDCDDGHQPDSEGPSVAHSARTDCAAS